MFRINLDPNTLLFISYQLGHNKPFAKLTKTKPCQSLVVSTLFENKLNFFPLYKYKIGGKLLSDAGVSSLHRLDWPSSVFLYLCLCLCICIFHQYKYKCVFSLHLLTFLLHWPASALMGHHALHIVQCTLDCNSNLQASANYRNTQYKHISQENGTDFASCPIAHH